MDTGFQVSLFSDRWTSFLANPLSVGSPVRAQLYTESEIDPSFFLCLALFFLLFLCVSRIEIKCAVCKISTVMGICSLGLNDPQVSGFITN